MHTFLKVLYSTQLCSLVFTVGAYLFTEAFRKNVMASVRVHSLSSFPSLISRLDLLHPTVVELSLHLYLPNQLRS